MADASTHPDPPIAGMGMLDLVDEVKRVREQRDDLRAENGELRLEAGGLTEDGRTVTDLERAEQRLRDGIRRHRDATYEIAGNPPIIEDHERDLWTLLDDRTETT